MMFHNSIIFFFNDTATTEIYTLSLHDALPIYLGIGYAVLGALLSITLIRDTRDHVRLDASASSKQSTPMSFREIFVLTSFRDRNLFAASQAGLVNNLNDGMSWGIFPLFFASFGLGVERIGILKAI